MSKSAIVTELRLRDSLRQWMIDEMNVEIDPFCGNCGESVMRGDITYTAERIADRLLDAISRGAFRGLKIAGHATTAPHPHDRIEMFDAALVLDAGGGP